MNALKQGLRRLVKSPLPTAAALLTLALAIGTSQLFGVRSHDLPTFCAMALLMALIAGAASFLPALRISRIQPADTLRAE